MIPAPTKTSIAVCALLALALVACGDGSPSGSACSDAGYAAGSTDSDGVFFSVVDRRCLRGRGGWCEARDARGPIAREIVDRGIDQDCVVYNQFLGVGVASGTGAYVGECAARAHAGLDRPLAAARRPSGDCPGGPASRLPRRSRSRRQVRIAGRARDPFERSPAARQGRQRSVRSPPWALLVWRQAGLICYEPGQVIDARRFREFAAVYRGGRQGEGLRGRLLGSLRPDAKFGVGRQFFDLGRFLPYPIAEGGSCGRLGDADLLLSRTWLYERPDLGEARTILAGVAGPTVTGIALITSDGARGPLLRSAGGRAFVAVLGGRRGPSEVSVGVTYASGRSRRFPPAS